MKLKTSELQRAALNWAVAKCIHLINGDDLDIGFIKEYAYTPSTNWAQGGPIIEREGITVSRTEQKSHKGQPIWVAYLIKHLFEDRYEHEYQGGPTPLIAAMRCYVASKLGDEVDVPDELFMEV